jgi:tRNA nucleotidyltransferase (CCA-adding enzyme)
MRFESERVFARYVRRRGGTLYVVGGALRDEVLGRVPHDRDYLVTGIRADKLGLKKVVGSDFPVFQVEIAGKTCEVALARRERKNGNGHKDFSVFSDESVTVEEDLSRRDVTINSMAKSVRTGEWVDPYGGRRDIRARVLRHTSEKFAEDPLRAYRVARFAATLGFDVAPETLKHISTLRRELRHLPSERVWKETEKALEVEGSSAYFRVLKEAGLLGVHFPEVEALEVPDRHDGTALNHTLKVLGAGRSPVERFSLLVHDAGKGLTPKESHPAHHGHDDLGEAPVRELCRRLRVPKAFETAGVSSATQHMRAKRAAEMRPGKLFNWVTAHRTHVHHILDVSFLDSAHREGANYDDEVARFENVRRLVRQVFEVERTITGKALLAEGLEPGKHFGNALFQRRVDAFERSRTSAGGVKT